MELSMELYGVFSNVVQAGKSTSNSSSHLWSPVGWSSEVGWFARGFGVHPNFWAIWRGEMMNFHAIMGTLGKQMQAAGPSVLARGGIKITCFQHLWAYGEGPMSRDRGVLGTGETAEAPVRFQISWWISRWFLMTQSVYIGISHGNMAPPIESLPHDRESKNAEGWTPLIWRDPREQRMSPPRSNQRDLASPALMIINGKTMGKPPSFVEKKRESNGKHMWLFWQL